MSDLPFIHLRVRSSYSLLQSTVLLPGLIDKCIANKMPAVAITDFGNMFGALEYSLGLSGKGIQPIHGVIFRFDSQLEKDEKIDEILVLSKSAIGYKNLLKLASKYYTEISDQGNVLTLEKLEQYSEGLIALTSWDKGTVGRLVLENRADKAEEFLLKLNSIFKDNLYIELIRCGEPGDLDKLEKVLIDFGLRHNIPFVATNEVYFLTKEMHEAHDILSCISDGKYIIDEDRPRVSAEHYLKSSEEMLELFLDIPEAIENTVRIAQRCSIKAEQREVVFPNYEVTVAKNTADELRVLSEKGLDEHLKLVPKEGHSQYRDRLKYELDIIIEMQFPSYLLIVADFINWSKKNNIPVGPGRGSGAGSIVSWCLGITDVDPIEYGLFFERFLNPERVSLPDLDIDFCQEKRDQVINYVREKYGSDKVAHIITFGKLQARAVIRDVGRVLQISYGKVDSIAKMVPFSAINPVTLSQAITMEEGIKQAMNNDSEVKKLIDISLKLEGLHRHASTHAAGVVIAADSLDETVPLYKDPKSDALVIQYSMKYAELAGLIKFDFLGLKTLTVIDYCTNLVKEVNPDFSVSTIPFKDVATFDLLSKGQSIGVFQFEKSSVRDALSKMKPDSIEDIIALGALNRPGPMDNIPIYIDCKHGLTEPNYVHPKLEEVLKKTFGVVIYQEQVMEVAKRLGGYTLGAADLLRRAMGKKIKAEMDQQKAIFIKGAKGNGLSQEEASNIFELIAKFAGYGFNRAHAVAYGFISYYTAYLKANYPSEFLVSIMNTEIDDTDKLNIFIQEAKELGIEVLPPSINDSEAIFSVVRKEKSVSIRYGLGALKNVSIAAMNKIVVERLNNGVFKSVPEFMERIGDGVINKRQLEHMIKAGVFDCVHKNRAQLFSSLEQLLKLANKNKADSNQMSLFSPKSNLSMTQLKEVDNWGYTERLHNECAAFGFYLSEHPLDVYKDNFAKISVYDAFGIKSRLASGRFTIKVAGIPVIMRIKSSPKGRYMLLSISTSTGMIEAMIFDDKLLEQHRDNIYAKSPMIFSVDVRKSGDFERITVQGIQELEDFLSRNKSKLIITLDQDNANSALKRVIRKCKDNEKPLNKVLLKVMYKQKVVQLEMPDKYFCDLATISTKDLPQGIKLIEKV